jgi:hypothetical protein
MNVVGMLVEGWGLILLFSGFLTRIIPFMRSIPVVSAIFYIPGVNFLADKLEGRAGVV